MAPSERNHAIAAPPRKRGEQPGRRQNRAVTSRGLELKGSKLDAAHAFDITGAEARLCASDGGYEIVHESRRLQICVYALVAPEPDHQRVNADDELYIVLEGSGMLDVDGEQLELREGHAAFVPAGAHHCFSAYEHLSVLAILEKRRGTSGLPPTAASVS